MEISWLTDASYFTTQKGKITRSVTSAYTHKSLAARANFSSQLSLHLHSMSCSQNNPSCDLFSTWWVITKLPALKTVDKTVETCVVREAKLLWAVGRKRCWVVYGQTWDSPGAQQLFLHVAQFLIYSEQRTLIHPVAASLACLCRKDVMSLPFPWNNFCTYFGCVNWARNGRAASMNRKWCHNFSMWYICVTEGEKMAAAIESPQSSS